MFINVVYILQICSGNSCFVAVVNKINFVYIMDIRSGIGWLAEEVLSWTDRPDELWYNFAISDDFTQMVNFPTGIPDWDSSSSALLISVFLLMQVFVLQWLFLHWKILIMLLSQCSLSLRPKRGSLFSSHSLWLFSCWLWRSSWSF